MKDNQCMKIIRFIDEYGGITQREAYKLGCTRLAARIHDIRHKYGKEVESKPVKVRNMDGSTSMVAFYYFREEGS